MKFSYLMLGILILFGGFQYLRVHETSSYSSLKQTYSFEVGRKESGELDIDNPQKHLVIYRESESTKEVYSNLEEFFKFAKTDYKVKYIDDTLDSLEEYSSITILTETYIGFKRDNFIKIKNFIEKGGDLIFLGTPPANPFNKIIGIEKPHNYIETEGVFFKQKFFPGLDSVRPSAEMMQGSTLDVDLSEDVKIIATDNYDTPIIWERSVGLGNVITTNTTLIEAKVSRGLLAQIVSYGNDYFIMPIFNSKLVHIDDFPAPIPNGSNKVIKGDYHMKTRDFFQKIWWKDMEGLGERQKLKYTGYIIGEYNDAVKKEDIVSSSNISMRDLSIFGRELLEYKGEIGVHGYNHNSLALEGGMFFKKYNYKPWSSKEDMKFGLEKLKDSMRSVYGEDIKVYSYVAPSNVLTLEGKEALVEVFPDLKTIGGLYIGEDSEKGILEQEIGRDPDYPEIYSMPRFSSGFFYTKDTMWNIYNGIAVYGLLAHFIHPDDIIDDERGRGQSWEILKKDFEKIFSDINENFPTLDPLVQSISTKRYITMEDIKISHEKKEDEIDVNIENYQGEISTFLRVRGKEIREVKGGEYRKVDSSSVYNLYLVKIQNKEVKILLKDS